MSASQFELNSQVLVYQGPLLYYAKIIKVYYPLSKLTKYTIAKQPHNVLETTILDAKLPKEYETLKCYKVHYKGWKDKWDEWVLSDRILNIDSESLLLMKSLKLKIKMEQQQAHNASGSKTALIDNNDNVLDGKTNGVPNGHHYNGSSSKPSSSSTTTTTGKVHHNASGSLLGYSNTKRKDGGLSNNQELRLLVPNSIKLELVEDWEKVTKNNQLVKVPCSYSITDILKRYKKELVKNVEQRTNNIDGRKITVKKNLSINVETWIDIQTEIVSSIQLYFEKALGSLILYRHERRQYKSMLDKYPGIPLCDIYGIVHLLRLLSILPNLVVSNGLDSQSIAHVKMFLEDFYTWVEKEVDVLVGKDDEDGEGGYENRLPGY